MLIKILIFLLISSCVSLDDNQKVQIFESHLSLKFLTAKKVEVNNSKNLNVRKPISRPVGAWVPILKFITDDVTDSMAQAFCLLYKVPIKDDGIIKIVQVELVETCRKKYERKSIAQLDKVESLEVYFSNYPQRGLRDFTLGLKFKRIDKEYFIKNPIYNYILSSRRSFERYSNSIRTSRSPGMKLYFNEVGIREKYIGKRRHTYKEKGAFICHQVDENCSDIKKNECNRCKFGHTEVISYKCPQGGTKICGQLECGLQGAPACIRGNNYSIYSSNDVCSKDSTVGFCKGDTTLHCDENNILICL